MESSEGRRPGSPAGSGRSAAPQILAGTGTAHWLGRTAGSQHPVAHTRRLWRWALSLPELSRGLCVLRVALCLLGHPWLQGPITYLETHCVPIPCPQHHAVAHGSSLSPGSHHILRNSLCPRGPSHPQDSLHVPRNPQVAKISSYVPRTPCVPKTPPSPRFPYSQEPPCTPKHSLCPNGTLYPQDPSFLRVPMSPYTPLPVRG